MNRSAPARLAAIARRALARDLTERYKSADALADIVDAYLGRRRWPWVVAVGLAMMLVGVGSWAWPRPAADIAAPMSSDVAGGVAPPAPPAAPDLLRVTALDINHFVRTGPATAAYQGPLGKAVPKLGDQVTVEARLSRPAYAYLVAFGPDGKVHRLTDDRPAAKAEVLRYPGTVGGAEDVVRYGLTDGTGLYVFAVVASDDPLPPFADVYGGGWGKEPASSGEAYRYDGEWVEPIAVDGVTRGERGPGERALGAPAGVVRAGAELRRGVPGRRVLAVGFGVGER
ncbi:MAG TPA: hypothetical protein VD866_31545 [Urbifossiella sp.]|nr:hypothetical protein [Urbifossiella sp.]